MMLGATSDNSVFALWAKTKCRRHFANTRNVIRNVAACVYKRSKDIDN